jgi:hypothetical protein
VKGAAKKLKLKKETLKDLEANKVKGVRGGMLFISLGKGGCERAIKTDGCGTAVCSTELCLGK